MNPKVLCANKDRSSGVGVCESKIINIINSRDQILNILHKHSSSLKYFVTEEQDETKVCQLISSAMCMGFFQNVCVHYKQKSFKLRNEIIHALFDTKATKYNMIVQNWKYFVFSEKVKMSGLFARAISPITPMQMLSMNNVRLTQLPIDQPNSSSLACCYDNWLNFSLTPNVLESCIAVRSLIEYMLNNISTLWLDNNCYFTRTKESQNTDYCEYIHNLRLHTDSFPLFALRICLAMMSDRSDQQVIYQLSENPLVTKYHQQCKDHSIKLNNPQMQRVREQNHEVSQFVNNPDLMCQTMEMIRIPTTIQEITRNHDRALINLESLPSGYNVRQRIYRDFQEPMLNVAHEQFGDNPLNTNSSSSSTANTSQAISTAIKQFKQRTDSITRDDNVVTIYYQLDSSANFENDIRIIRDITQQHVKCVDPNKHIDIRGYYIKRTMGSLFSMRTRTDTVTTSDVVYKYTCNHTAYI
ncbi:hypothetical protein GJ496_008040 [Pomphorhynchus laevis]|nr:hypothetical protein GJ496_008040 [Pomphorhynchus laevis]